MIRNQTLNRWKRELRERRGRWRELKRFLIMLAGYRPRRLGVWYYLKDCVRRALKLSDDFVLYTRRRPCARCHEWCRTYSVTLMVCVHPECAQAIWQEYEDELEYKP